MHKVRQSNFELLRIIAMFMIVSGHFISQSGGGGADTTGLNLFFAVFAGSGSRIAVNLFLMIGCWFMVDAKFKPASILKLYGEVWIYTVVFTVVAAVLGVDIFPKGIINAIFPFVRGSLWYATIYIELLLLSPFLKKIFKWKQKQLRLLVVLLFLMVCCISSVHKMMDTYFCALIWFVFIYAFIGYYKKYIAENGKYNYNIFLILGIALYVLMIFGKYICVQMADTSVLFSFGEKVISQFLSDYKSLPNFLCSILIFSFFEKMDIGEKKGINWVAKSAFGVYVIHQVPAFHDVLWNKIFFCSYWMNTQYFIPFSCLLVIITYFGCMLIDALRRKYIEPFYVRSKLFCKLENIINKIYGLEK